MIDSSCHQNSPICEHREPALIGRGYTSSLFLRPIQVLNAYCERLNPATYHHGDGLNTPLNFCHWDAARNCHGRSNETMPMPRFARTPRFRSPKTSASGTTGTMKASPRLKSEKEGETRQAMAVGISGKTDVPVGSKFRLDC